MKSIVANGHGPKQAAHQADPPKVAAIYTRVSTQEQAEKGYSLPTQKESCMAMVRSQGYQVPDEYVIVDDFTGTTLKRPGLTRLRALVTEGRVDAVIVHDLDRLSRKLAHQLLLCDEFQAANVQLHVVTMPDMDRSPESQLLANVRGTIAEYEREKLRERTARGRKGKATSGKSPGGVTPFGYTPSDGQLTIQEDEAAIIRRIFTLYLTGQSCRTIARRLTDEAVPSASDRRKNGPQRKLKAGVWMPSVVHQIIQSETYVGRLYYGKQTRVNGKMVPVPRDEWILIPVPTIIDEATWQAAQKQSGVNTVRSTRNRKAEYLLSGHLYCATCNNRMGGQRANSKSDRRVYRCPTPKYSRETPCRGIANADALEQEVWSAVENALQNPALIAQEVTRRQHAHTTDEGTIQAERRSYEGQLARLERELSRWEQAYAGEVIELEEFKHRKAEIASKQQAISKELSRLDDEARALQKASESTATLIEFCEMVRGKLGNFGYTEKRLALESLAIKVVWERGEPLQISGSIPVHITSDMACHRVLQRYES